MTTRPTGSEAKTNPGPDPVGISPPQAPLSSNGAARPKSEEDQNHEPPPPPPGDECQPTDPLAEHLAASLWPGRGRMLAESKLIVDRCLAVADRSVVDECIGAMIAADDKPRSPNYLLTTVRNRLVSMGAYAPGDEALASLGRAG